MSRFRGISDCRGVSWAAAAQNALHMMLFTMVPDSMFRKEIPWNLFSPKAPYNGKVVANDFHPQTLTEPTGDANWETTHVTFDHGGKVPYIEGQSIGVI